MWERAWGYHDSSGPCCCAVSQSYLNLWHCRLQQVRLPCLSPTLGVCSNSCPLSWWCHPTISSSVIPFSSCLRYFPASGSFPMNGLFASGGQNIRASASDLPMNIQGWFPLRLTDLIWLLFKGLSKVFSRTVVWRHQFFGTFTEITYLAAWVLPNTRFTPLRWWG